MRGCTVAGDLNNADYGRPMPWIGLYVAAASFLCAAAMAFDAYSGFRRGRFWFPPRLFSLNAATLTLLGVATKFPVDLNTSMPRPADQLTKLSGTTLICVAMANFLPSLGAMEGAEIVSNVAAVGILVATVVVNVCIQMRTGVIYAFLPEHAVVMLLMLVLLAMMFSSALSVTTLKEWLEGMYDREHKVASTDQHADYASLSLTELKKHVKRYWLMAHSAGAQHVLGRSTVCTASGGFCLAGASVFTEALLRAFFIRKGSHQLEFCSGKSDYRWSTILVLIVQAAALLTGTVGPTYRWLYDGYSRSSDDEILSSCSDVLSYMFYVGKYWYPRLKRWREATLSFRLSSMWGWKAVHHLRSLALDALITMQFVVVWMSKFVLLFPMLIAIWLNMGTRLKRKMEGSQRALGVENCIYDLEMAGSHLDDLISCLELGNIEERMEMARRDRPASLIALIKEHSTISEGFREVGALDRWSVPFLVDPDGEASHCWALPVVTLAGLAVALHRIIGQDPVGSLLRGVHEGLRFVRFVDRKLGPAGIMHLRAREAAEIAWSYMSVNRRWFRRDLRHFDDGDGTDGARGRKAVEAIARYTQLYVKSGVEVRRLERGEVLAGQLMHKVCGCILEDYDAGKLETDDDLFAWLRRAIADLLGACLTNLPRAIYLECSSDHRGKERERGARDAAVSLAEAEGIIEMLQDPQVTPLLPPETQYVDQWLGRRGQMGP